MVWSKAQEFAFQASPQVRLLLLQPGDHNEGLSSKPTRNPKPNTVFLRHNTLNWLAQRGWHVPWRPGQEGVL